MAARVGLVTGGGLGEAIRARFTMPAARTFAVALVISAIALGNAAYETGNLLGAGLGAAGVLGGSPRAWALAIAALAALLLFLGRYGTLERVLVLLVAVMALVFLATAVVLRPSPAALASGLFVPRLPGGVGTTGGLLIAIGLIGTTVVPYNLFLHASAVSQKWQGVEELPRVRVDLAVSILLGGVVSMAIVATAAAVPGGISVEGAADMAAQLEPLLGRWAQAFFATGLLAAGLTSAVTAPLAAAYACAGALGWSADLRDRRLRAVWAGVIATGALFAATGVRPVPAILFAQVANGLLLPGIAAFLLIVVNDRAAMGSNANGPTMNMAGGAVVLITLALGIRAVFSAF
jgi:Mn2+/Fe2+ NRAMP family transporter